MKPFYPYMQSGYTFLNHAATCGVSESTAQVMKEFCAQMCEPLGLHFYSWLSTIEQTRQDLADLIGASGSEIAFCSNTSMALSLIAHAIDWKAGDRILVPEDEFSSNIYVWQNLKKRGVHTETFLPTPGEPIDTTLAKQNLSRVKLISLSAVSYKSGRLYELERFSQFCKSRGILSCLDAIQAIGTCEINLHKLDLDFAAGGAQKWLLGPIGCGFFFAKRSCLPELNVSLVGWTSSMYPERFEIKTLEFTDELARFEPGLPNIIPIAGLGQSLKELKQVGWRTIFAQAQAKRDYIHKHLCDLGLTPLLAPSDLSAAIASFQIDKAQYQTLQKLCQKRKIIVTLRPLEGTIQDASYVLRISPHYTNTSKELDLLLNTIQESQQNKPVKQIHRSSQREGTNLKKAKIAAVIGPTGTLGEQICYELAQRDYELILIGRNAQRLNTLDEELKKDFKTLKTTIYIANLEEHEINWANLLQAQQRTASHVIWAINDCCIDCNGAVETQMRQRMWQVNVESLQAMTNAYEELCKDQRAPTKGHLLAILQVTSKLPLPYLANFLTTQSAVWTYLLSSSLQWEKLFSTSIFINGPIHSKLQKRMGRRLLRFFQVSQEFDHYDHAHEVAKKAIDSMECSIPLVASFKQRVLLTISTLWPNWWQRKIRKKLR